LYIDSNLNLLMVEQTSAQADKAGQQNNRIDIELVRKALLEPEDFGVLIERYETKLMRYVMAFTNLDHQSAEDILQETFIKTYKNLNGFNQSLTFSSWIYRIARNEALNYLKKHKNKNISLDAEDQENMALINILASDENTQLKVSNQETSAKVREVLNLLKDDYREVLVLKFLEDYDYSEISTILKKPLGTVGVLIGRAKDAFRQLAEKNNLYEHEQR